MTVSNTLEHFNIFNSSSTENKVIRLYNSRTRKAVKALQPNRRGGSTLNLNRNSDVGNITIKVSYNPKRTHL